MTPTSPAGTEAIQYVGSMQCCTQSSFLSPINIDQALELPENTNLIIHHLRQCHNGPDFLDESMVRSIAVNVMVSIGGIRELHDESVLEAVRKAFRTVIDAARYRSNIRLLRSRVDAFLL